MAAHVALKGASAQQLAWGGGGAKEGAKLPLGDTTKQGGGAGCIGGHNKIGALETATLPLQRMHWQ